MLRIFLLVITLSISGAVSANHYPQRELRAFCEDATLQVMYFAAESLGHGAPAVAVKAEIHKVLGPGFRADPVNRVVDALVARDQEAFDKAGDDFVSECVRWNNDHKSRS